jgi:hypothetical protein
MGFLSKQVLYLEDTHVEKHNKLVSESPFQKQTQVGLLTYTKWTHTVCIETAMSTASSVRISMETVRYT